MASALVIAVYATYVMVAPKLDTATATFDSAGGSRVLNDRDAAGDCALLAPVNTKLPVYAVLPARLLILKPVL